MIGVDDLFARECRSPFWFDPKALDVGVLGLEVAGHPDQGATRSHELAKEVD